MCQDDHARLDCSGPGKARTDRRAGRTGIVTLASLLPVLSVELFSIGIRATTEKEDILANIINVSEVDGQFLETTPWREIYFALRAILPLNIILVFLVCSPLTAPASASASCVAKRART